MSEFNRQEAFNKAVLGLHSQGYERCVTKSEHGSVVCMYADGQGKHCAWGWVDPATWVVGLDKDGDGVDLKGLNVGIAPKLSYDDRNFAEELQGCHDNATGPKHMKSNLHTFAAKYMLTFPELP